MKNLNEPTQEELNDWFDADYYRALQEDDYEYNNETELSDFELKP